MSASRRGISQGESFDKVKEAIATTAMSGADLKLQIHLADDARETAVGDICSNGVDFVRETSYTKRDHDVLFPDDW